MVVKLDRIGRSVRNLIDVAEELRTAGVDLIVLDQGLDTTTPSGRVMFHVMAAIAEFEADLVRERTLDGLAAARARGRKGGRRRKLSEAQEAHVLELYDALGEDGQRRFTVDAIGKLVGNVSRPTVYAAIERQRAKQAKAKS